MCRHESKYSRISAGSNIFGGQANTASLGAREATTKNHRAVTVVSLADERERPPVAFGHKQPARAL